MNPMSRIVRTVTRYLYPFVILFGFYIIIHGHLTPGGGFQGGAVIASAFAMVIVAFGSKHVDRWYSEEKFSVVESSGLLAFVTLAFLGIGVMFFYNFLANGRSTSLPWLFGDITSGINSGALNTAGTIPLMNIAVGLEVLAGLGAIVYMMFHGREA